MKKRTKKTRKNSYKFSEIFAGLFGYFLFVFLINLASRGLDKNLLFNPYDAALFLGEQIGVIIKLPLAILIILGFILTFIPLVFFYVLVRDIKKNYGLLH